MKTTLAFVAASALVNLIVLGALDLSVRLAQRAPAGEVSVRQLPDRAELPVYAQARRGEARSASAL